MTFWFCFQVLIVLMAIERKPKAPHLDFRITYKVWNMSFQLKYTYSSIIIGKEKKKVWQLCECCTVSQGITCADCSLRQSIFLHTIYCYIYTMEQVIRLPQYRILMGRKIKWFKKNIVFHMLCRIKCSAGHLNHVHMHLHIQVHPSQQCPGSSPGKEPKEKLLYIDITYSCFIVTTRFR